MKSRVDRLTWDAEMLCERPRRTESVYAEFDPNTHVYGDGASEHGYGAAAGAPRTYIGGMDFGFRSEAVVLLASVDSAGVLRIEREHVARAMTLARHVAVIRGWIDSGLAGDGIAWIGIDPAGRQANSQTGDCDATILQNADLRVRSRASKVDEGIRLVRARLRPASWFGTGWTAVSGRTAPGSGISAGPRLFIHERCTHLIEALERYHYNASRPDDPEPVKDGPDHACDALRYMVLNLDKPHETRSSSY